MLGWKMTLGEYCSYFLSSSDYQAYCSMQYPGRSSKTGETPAFMAAMYFLLNGTKPADRPEIQTFLAKVLYNPNYNPGTGWGNVNTAFGIKLKDKQVSDYTAFNDLFGIGSDKAADYDEAKKEKDKILDDIEARKQLTIEEAYNRFLHKISGNSKFEFTKELESNLKNMLDTLLTPLPVEQIMDRIQVGGCRQMIFTGAPGTGKTYFAKNIARMACEAKPAWGATLKNDQTKEEDPYTFVQFHPSYDYTDFVEGLRPITAAGEQKVEFAKVDGTFKAFCRKVVKANQEAYQGYMASLPDTLEGYAKQLSSGSISIATAKKVWNELDTLAGQLKPDESTPVSSKIKPILSDMDEVKTALRPYLLKDFMDQLQWDLENHKAFSTMNADMVSNRIFRLEFLFKQLPKDSAPSTAGKAAKASADPLSWKSLKDQSDALSSALKSERITLMLQSLEELLKDLLVSPNTSKGAQSPEEKAAAVKQYFIAHKNDFISAAKISKPNFTKLESAITGKSAKKETVAPDYNAALELVKKLLEEKYSNTADDALTKTAAIKTALDAKVAAGASGIQAMEKLAQKMNALLMDPANYESVIDPDTLDYKLCFFIIDEINRANLSKVFGELMYCLEKDKRGKTNHIQTQYQNLDTYDLIQKAYLVTPSPEDPEELHDCFKGGFYIPKNVVVIGTMNDIDRSVDSMDFALRRRFDWVEFKVGQDTLISAFQSGNYGEVMAQEAQLLASCVMSLNEYLSAAGADYGLNRQYYISQGQFSNLPTGSLMLSEIVDYAWEYRIESLLREYLRGESEEKISEFIEGAKQALEAPLVKSMEVLLNTDGKENDSGNSENPDASTQTNETASEQT